MIFLLMNLNSVRRPLFCLGRLLDLERRRKLEVGYWKLRSPIRFLGRPSKNSSGNGNGLVVLRSVVRKKIIATSEILSEVAPFRKRSCVSELYTILPSCKTNLSILRLASSSSCFSPTRFWHKISTKKSCVNDEWVRDVYSYERRTETFSQKLILMIHMQEFRLGAFDYLRHDLTITKLRELIRFYFRRSSRTTHLDFSAKSSPCRGKRKRQLTQLRGTLGLACRNKRCSAVEEDEKFEFVLFNFLKEFRD